MLRVCMILCAMLMAVSAHAQGWSLVDSGVGLIIQDENYAQELKVVQRGTVWDVKELYENGAQAGKYRGNQLFAAWIRGPHTNEFLNSNGVPVWLYTYRITNPDGTTFEGGPHGFYTPGFAYFNINTGKYTNGNWKIDWYIVHRDTKEVRRVGGSEFRTTYGK